MAKERFEDFQPWLSDVVEYRSSDELDAKVENMSPGQINSVARGMRRTKIIGRIGDVLISEEGLLTEAQMRVNQRRQGEGDHQDG